MNTTLVIASRELRERWRVFIVAVALAALPFVVAAMPGMRGNRSMIIATLAGAGAMNYAFAVALLLGATVIARDLSEKRMSFYFSKPVSPWALWGGKAGAALVTILGVVLIIAVPALLAVPEQWQTVWGRDQGLVVKLAPLAALFFFLIAHTIATIVRSRSILLVADFVLAIATVLVAMLIARPLIVRGAMVQVFGVWSALALALLVILALAPVAQLARGRTDVRRSHIALSSTLWPAVAVALLAGTAYSWWTTSPSLQSLDRVENLQQSASGEWVFLTGFDNARGDIPASFLLDTARGTTERLDPVRWSGVYFSRSGNVIAWLEADELFPNEGAARVHTRALTPGAPRRATAITGSITDTVVLSDDGSRIALLGRGQVRVHDLATGTLLAAARMEQSPVKMMFFPSPSALRMVSISRSDDKASIFELDVARKTLVKTGEFAPRGNFGWNSLTATENGDTFYVTRSGTILDGRTGAVRAVLPVGARNQRASVMLKDGRVVWVHEGTLRLFDRGGAVVRDIRLPVVIGIVSGETADGKVIVIGRTAAREKVTMKVDLSRGVVEKALPGVHGPENWIGIEPRLPKFAAGARLTAVKEGTARLTHWQ